MSDSKVAGFMLIALFAIGSIQPIAAVMVAAGSPLAVGLGAVWPYIALVIAVMALGFSLQTAFKRY